tara:strand:+ start:8941 stop:9513 length:573 start_codon:yes stop_codon:yes gene_type:complete
MPKRESTSKKYVPKIPRILEQHSKRNSRVQKRRFKNIKEKLKRQRSKLISQEKLRKRLSEKLKKQREINEQMSEKKELEELRRMLYMNRYRQQQALLRGPPQISVNNLANSLNKLSTYQSRKRSGVVNLNSVLGNEFWKSAPQLGIKSTTTQNVSLPPPSKIISQSLKIPKRRFKPRTNVQRKKVNKMQL